MSSESMARSEAGRPIPSRPRSGFLFWKVLAVAGITAATLALLLTPRGAFGQVAPPDAWSITRASALVAYGLLWLSMLAGLSMTSRLSRLWPGGPTTFALHRFSSLLGLGFALLHAL